MVTGNEGASAVKIEAFRTARNLSQAELAEKALTTQPSIARIEKGVDKPSVALLAKIAKVLEVDIGQLCNI